MQVTESNMSRPTCRICRYERESQEVISCPCKCAGTVGFVHATCLRRWIALRGSSDCELCAHKFDRKFLKVRYVKWILALFKWKYLGVVIRDAIYVMSITPLVHLSFSQVKLMDDLVGIETAPAVKKTFVIPFILLGTCLYFLSYFNWTVSRGYQCKEILTHWWMFGDQDDDGDDLDYFPSLDSGIFDSELWLH